MPASNIFKASIIEDVLQCADYEVALHAAAGALIAWLGFAWFQKTRKGFADVL